MQLKQEFNLADFTYSETATRLKIDNAEMTPEQLTSLKELHAMLLDLESALCKHFNTVVHICWNSAFRSKKLNDYFIRTIGASKTSQHLDGQAIDSYCTGITLNQYFEALKEFAKDKSFTFGQVIAEFGVHPETSTDDWNHVSSPVWILISQVKTPKHVNEFMTKQPGKGYQTVKL